MKILNGKRKLKLSYSKIMETQSRLQTEIPMRTYCKNGNNFKKKTIEGLKYEIWPKNKVFFPLRQWIL